MPRTDETPVAVRCRPDEVSCDGSRCIPAAWVCDRSLDCADGSDEPDSCPAKEPCSSWAFECLMSGVCIPQGWVCDGEPDCGRDDNSDEHRDTCAGNSSCPANTYQCDDLLACVPLSSLCNSNPDCKDGSDEGDFCSETTCDSEQCAHQCTPTPAGARCYCPYGQEPIGSTCRDETFSVDTVVNKQNDGIVT
ncbi:Low-density lipoprotein (LDL) receptor class A repeat [Trinorchestia longiramus]|nr:Low-density lipoprotein (LDL) receptor class A repeat [Trinorchestia longiramus]